MPNRNIKIVSLPINIIENDSKANLQTVISRIKNIDADTDLVVLPEMFNTGFTPDYYQLTKNAQPNDGEVITILRDLAVKNNIAIWGGFTAIENNLFYNRGFMISDVGNIDFYDKHHLFRYGGESKLLTPGRQISPIINFRSWNLKMSICYDLRFPAWNRCRGNDYDALIVPANWAHARNYAWRQLIIARAIENQAYVIGCNREGEDKYGSYNRGDSLSVNHWGDIISDLREDGSVYAILDHETFNKDRQRFEPWRDADDFQIIIDS